VSTTPVEDVECSSAEVWEGLDGASLTMDASSTIVSTTEGRLLSDNLRRSCVLLRLPSLPSLVIVRVGEGVEDAQDAEDVESVESVRCGDLPCFVYKAACCSLLVCIDLPKSVSTFIAPLGLAHARLPRGTLVMSS